MPSAHQGEEHTCARQPDRKPRIHGTLGTQNGFVPLMGGAVRIITLTEHCSNNRSSNQDPKKQTFQAI